MNPQINSKHAVAYGQATKAGSSALSKTSTKDGGGARPLKLPDGFDYTQYPHYSGGRS